AWRLGLRAGDRLLAVDGQAVPTANHALSALAKASARGSVVELTTERSGTVRLDEAADPLPYPYGAMRGFRGFEWGLILVENLKFAYLKELRALIESH